MDSELMKDRIFEWSQTATSDDQCLFERVEELSHLFDDMLFRGDTLTHDFVACKTKSFESDEWADADIPLPEELEYFSYSFFTFYVRELGGYLGEFSHLDYSLTVDTNSLKNNSVILHEMIHLHEFVINRLPLFYHDAIIYCLYKDLAGKISDLDDRIEAHGHIFNSQQIASAGGTHDILFLLKSFDLDLKMGYPLGTVFGYGMATEI